MKPPVVVHKIFEQDSRKEPLEWEDDNEANEEDITQMANCMITLVVGAIIVAGVILYFLIF